MSVAPKVGVVPEIGFEWTSIKVIVTVEVATPSATTGVVLEIEEVVALAVPV